MTDKPENPPAFPHSLGVEPDDHSPEGGAARFYGEGGMTLRDYFAGQALAGLAVDPKLSDTYSWNYLVEAIAQDAYRFADAMLVERKG